MNVIFLWIILYVYLYSIVLYCMFIDGTVMYKIIANTNLYNEQNITCNLSKLGNNKKKNTTVNKK